MILRNIFFSYFLILLFCFLSVTRIAAQPNSKYTAFRYTSKNGLPQNSIKSIVMDNNRYLWMSTEGGLVRFDGSNFKTYNHTNTPIITNDRFGNILKTTDGRLVTDELSGNIFEIKDGKIELLSKNDSQQRPITVANGGLPDVLFYIKFKREGFGLSAQNVNLSNNQPIFYPINKNSYFVKSATLISLYENNIETVTINLSKWKSASTFMLKNEIYFFDTSCELFKIDFTKNEKIKINITGDFQTERFKGSLIQKNVIWDYANEHVFLKSDNLLYQLEYINDSEIKSTLKIDNAPENCFVLGVVVDPISQSLFVGTDSKGLYIYRKQRFTVTLQEGNQNKFGNGFYTTCVVDSETVLVGFDREASIKGIKKSRYQFRNFSTECTLSSTDRNIYFVRGDTIVNYNINTGTETYIVSGSKNNFFCFYPDSDSIFTGSINGVGYIKNNTYHQVSKPVIIQNNELIEDIVRTPKGELWIADCGGVSSLNTQTGIFDTIAGLQNICARTFFKHDSILFLGTYGDGFYAIIKNSITKFPLDKNRFLTHVHSFYIDNNSFFWMSTNKGLLRTHLNNIIKHIKYPEFRVSYYYFGEDDGILNTEFNGGCSPPMSILKNGFAVYPTMEGLVWFKPDSMLEIIPNEKILLDEIRIDGKTIKIQNKINVPSDHELVEFRFSTPYWGNIASLDIDYQLIGFNKAPIPLNAYNNIISFSNLPSGKYKLIIRKLNAANNISQIKLEIPFTVEKKIYETIPFILFVSFAIAGILFSIIKFNTNRIRKQNIQLEIKVTERTLELLKTNIALKHNVEKLALQETFLKESIKVKDKLVAIISHDIITPLKFISMVSRISKKNKNSIERNKLLDSLSDIEFAADKLHNNATNILNWMKLQNNRIVPHIIHIAIHDLVEECMEPMKGMAAIRNIELKNEISEEEIIQSDKHILSIILQNLISNAIKYTQDGSVTISGNSNNNEFAISIVDTGIGFSNETLKKINSIIEGGVENENSSDSYYLENGLGYSLIVKLLIHISGKITLQSIQGKGSTISVTIPKVG